MLKGKLLPPLLGLLLLAGCQTIPPHEEAPPVELAKPQKPLAERWRQISTDPGVLEDLLSRLGGKALRNQVRGGVAAATGPRVALARLNRAKAHAREARAIVSAQLGYRRAGGVALNTGWEQDLWKRLKGVAGEPGSVVVEISDADLLGAHRSLAAQISKAWFYARGVRLLRQRAEEIHELQLQLLEREQTSTQLELGNRADLMAIRKELARADTRAKQLKRAEILAHKALVALTGNSRPSALLQKAAVSPVPGDLTLALLMGRPDVNRGANRLVEVEVIGNELDRLLPDVVLTAKGGRITRALSDWTELKPASVAKRLNLESLDRDQAEAIEEFSELLLSALMEVRAMLKDGRQLQGQRSNLKAKEQEARRIVNRLRALYSARRADLTEIIEAQQVLAEIAGKLAYVQNRVFGQRLDTYLAFGGAGF